MIKQCNINSIYLKACIGPFNIIEKNETVKTSETLHKNNLKPRLKEASVNLFLLFVRFNKIVLSEPSWNAAVKYWDQN